MFSILETALQNNAFDTALSGKDNILVFWPFLSQTQKPEKRICQFITTDYEYLKSMFVIVIGYAHILSLPWLK